ncbi:MAG: hypothetical protein HC767_02585 [Akkermansiaceae bacterium]|nr:hypothetical protein [Akkermansiaceae bacterium]
MKRWLPWLLISLLVGAWFLAKPRHRGNPTLLEKSPPPAVEAATPRITPALLPARVGTPDDPLQSWERLLVIDGTPAEDRVALSDLVTNYLQGTNISQRPPLGTNEEITRALSDPAVLGKTAIPTSHPAILSGQLVDRWGSPWFFHQASANVFEVRSPGPDRRLYTDDDVKE